MPNQRVEYVPGMRCSDFEKYSDLLGMDRPGTISDVLRVRDAGDIIYFDGYASSDISRAHASKRFLHMEMRIKPEEIRVYRKHVRIEETEDSK